MTGMCQHAQPSLLRQGLANFFCLGWSGTVIFLISASLIALWTSLYHRTQLLVEIGPLQLFVQAVLEP
jgi:hypothetical protein